MRQLRNLLLLLASLALVAALASAQDDDSQPSLGAVARQARQQKQKGEQGQSNAQPAAQEKDPQNAANTKDAPPKAPKKVITNDEIPTRIDPTALPPHTKSSTAPEPPQPKQNDEGEKQTADNWKNQILNLKQGIAGLENQIQDITDSIRYAGNNCASNCEQWNLAQKQKQQQVDDMTAQMLQQQKTLEDLQETARKQGYNSAVYDP